MAFLSDYNNEQIDRQNKQKEGINCALNENVHMQSTLLYLSMNVMKGNISKRKINQSNAGNITILF